MTDELKRTPLCERQQTLGGRMVPFAGWEMAVQFAGVKEEHRVVREHVGLFDVSHMGELELQGSGAAEALDSLVTNDVANLPPGRAIYTFCCNEGGTILDDLIVYRTAPERLLVVCNASNRAKIAAHLAKRLAGRCEFHDRSDDFALLALQGPAAAAVLKDLGAGADQLETVRNDVRQARLLGNELMLARTGYTGEDGFELFCPPDRAAAIWDGLLEAGQAHGIQPIGLGARDTLRLEARLCLYGNDIDETTNPYEAGLGWAVKLDKGPFLGREALQRVKAERPARRLVGFEMVGRGIGRHGYPILDRDGAPLGQVTSGAPGLSVGKNIGLGYVPRAHSKVGTQIGIEIRSKVVEAVLVKTPFYRRGQ